MNIDFEIVDKSVIYIDGGYLNNILRMHGFPRLDFQKLSNVLATGTDRLRTYYYTCMPFQSTPATQPEKDRYSKMDKFVNSLKSLPRFEVKLGRLQRIQDGGQVDFIQKGVDMMLGVDLVRMSWQKQMNKAVIMTSDSDFVYAIKAAKDAGIITQLCYSPLLPVNQSLLDEVDEDVEFNQTIVDQCKF